MRSSAQTSVATTCAPCLRHSPSCRPFRGAAAARQQSNARSSSSKALRGGCASSRQQRCPQLACRAASAAAEVTIEQGTHILPDGMRLELLHAAPVPGSAVPGRPPLLFVHGSYHGAWCWREHFLPFFAAAGWDCYALSLRGQGGSDRGDLRVSGTLESHADDLASVVSALPAPPVLIGHSFGGLLVEKYATQLSSRPALAALALLASVPPTGNGGIVGRITRKSLVLAWKITWAFVGKSFVKSVDECRDTFFSKDLPEADLRRYHAQLAACSPVKLLDLGALRKELPLPPAPAGLPAFVGGGDADLVVDVPAVEEAAAWLGVQPVIWRGMAHDVMLDTRWEEAAASLQAWLDSL